MRLNTTKRTASPCGDASSSAPALPRLAATIGLTLVVFAVGCQSVAEAAPLSSHWDDLGPVDGATQTTILLPVRNAVSVSQLAATCAQVSDPLSPDYGKFWTKQQIADLVTDKHAVDVVTGFMSSVGDGTVSLSSTGDVVVASRTAAAIALHFGVSAFHRFVHRPTGAYILRAPIGEELTIPAALRPHVSHVFGVTDFPPPPKQSLAQRRHAAAADASSATSTEADDASPFAIALAVFGDGKGYIYVVGDHSLKPLVKGFAVDLSADNGPFKTYVPESTTPTEFGLLLTLDIPEMGTYSHYRMNASLELTNGTVIYATSLPDDALKTLDDAGGLAAAPFLTPSVLKNFYGYSIVDVSQRSAANSQAVAEFSAQYFNIADLKAYWSTYKLEATGRVSIIGPDVASRPTLEADMDIQLITAVAPNVDTVFYSVNSTVELSFIYDWAVEMNAMEHPPLVTSISYAVEEVQLPPGYIQLTDSELLKLCMRGVSVLVASGDGGATNIGHGGDTCTLAPLYPASSPWVTTVSATLAAKDPAIKPRNGNLDGAGEAAVSISTGCLWTTGGGFSGVHPQPAYQQHAVSDYLSSSVPMPAGFNRSNRAYPDISATGRNYPIFLNGDLIMFGDGTSAATPVTAGMLSLVNSERLKQGKPAVGFANPLLYHLYDLHPGVYYDVTAGANKCGAFQCCDIGFEATKGYDAVTGVGTIGDFQAFLQLAVSAASTA